MNCAKVSRPEKEKPLSALRSLSNALCDRQKFSLLPICPLRRLWRGPVRRSALQRDELAALRSASFRRVRICRLGDLTTLVRCSLRGDSNRDRARCTDFSSSQAEIRLVHGRRVLLRKNCMRLRFVAAASPWSNAVEIHHNGKMIIENCDLLAGYLQSCLRVNKRMTVESEEYMLVPALRIINMG